MGMKEIAVVVILLAWITIAVLCIVRLQRSGRQRQPQPDVAPSRR